MNKTEYYILGSDNVPGQTPVSEEHIQTLVNVGQDPTIVAAGEKDWKTAATYGFRELVQAPPPEVAQAATPPAPVPDGQPPQPAVSPVSPAAMMPESRQIPQPPPTATAAAAPAPAQPVDYIALLKERLAAIGITEEDFIKWGREQGWAKPRCKKIETAVAPEAAQKLDANWPTIESILRARAGAVAQAAGQAPPPVGATAAPLPAAPPPVAAPVPQPVVPVTPQPVVPVAPTPQPVAPVVVQPVIIPVVQPITPVAPQPLPVAPVVQPVIPQPVAPVTAPQPVAAGQAPVQLPAVQPQPQHAVVVQSQGAISGEISQSDFKMPSMKVIQGNSPSVALFGSGAIVVSDQILIPAPVPGSGIIAHEALWMVPAALHKNFVEDLPYDPKNIQRGRTVETSVEVAQLGGTLLWNDREKPTWTEQARILMYIRRPDPPEHPGYGHSMFSHQADDGSMWGMCVVWCKKGAYKHCAKDIISASAGALMTPQGCNLAARMWTLTYMQMPSGDFQIWTPKAVIQPHLTPASIQKDAAAYRSDFEKGTGVEGEGS